MMKTRFFSIILLSALLGWFGLPNIARAQTPSNMIVVSSSQHISGNVATVSQDITVDGEVAGDVTSWSGNITITGQVAGDVVSYAGQVLITPHAHVGGHVLALSGLKQQPGAQISGQAMSGTKSSATLVSVLGLFAPRVDAPARERHLLERILIGAALAVFLLVFSVLWVALWPRRTTAATMTLLGLPWRSASLGLLTTGLVALLLPPISALLSATLIGLPLLALLLIALNLPYVYGFAITAHAFAAGRTTNVALSENQINTRAFVIAALLAVMIAVVMSAWPLAGLMLLYIVASPGLGAAILSRGGLIVPPMALKV